MPAPRVPTSILEARGAFRKNPARGRERENEPVVEEEIGEPPACFLPVEMPGETDPETGAWIRHPSVYDPAERKRLRGIWHELIAQAAPGVLNRAHRMHLEVTCGLVDARRRGVLNTGGLGQLNKYLTQMGMNPAAQSTVSGGGRTKPSAGAFGRLRGKAQAMRAG